MNLYKIKFSHTAPKDTTEGLVCLLLTQGNDEAVYNWIKSEPNGLYNSWADKEKAIYNHESDVFDDEVGFDTGYYWTDENGKPIDFKTKMLSIKGEMNDEDYDLSDAYYGITLYGWELLKENVTTDYSELFELGILFTC